MLSLWQLYTVFLVVWLLLFIVFLGGNSINDLYGSIVTHFSLVVLASLYCCLSESLEVGSVVMFAGSFV